MGDFLSDIETLRRNAREHIGRGPITDAYGADLERVIEVLNEALATELVCVLRYKRREAPSECDAAHGTVCPCRRALEAEAVSVGLTGRMIERHRGPDHRRSADAARPLRPWA